MNTKKMSFSSFIYDISQYDDFKFAKELFLEGFGYHRILEKIALKAFIYDLSNPYTEIVKEQLKKPMLDFEEERK